MKKLILTFCLLLGLIFSGFAKDITKCFETPEGRVAVTYNDDKRYSYKFSNYREFQQFCLDYKLLAVKSITFTSPEVEKYVRNVLKQGYIPLCVAEQNQNIFIKIADLQDGTLVGILHFLF